MTKFSLLSLAAIAALASEPVAIQKITVTEDTPTAEVTQESIAASAAKNMTGDSASRLADAPGVSLYTGGGISSLPVIHGMADDRVKIDVDGMTITSACPNHMNPALSYTDTSKIAEMDVVAGITPVSQGGDSIGGTIVVKSKDPVFAQKSGEVVMSGDVTGFYHSNNAARGAALNANAANDKISVSYSGYAEKANDYKNGNGVTVKDTLYEQQNHSGTIAYKLDEGTLSFELGTRKVNDEGFPNQYMDMLDNRATHENLSYKGKIGDTLIDANIFRQDTSHYMNKILTERTGNMPMNTEADEMGYNVKATIPLNASHVLKVGSDYDTYRLNDWWPADTVNNMPGMSPNTFVNINNGRRDRIGLFTESDYQWSDKLSTLFGVRMDIVTMNTGDVVGYNSTSNDPTDAAYFNSLDHSKRDNNFDLTAMTKYENDKNSDFEFGFARKTRSPNMYERYSWAGSTPGITLTNAMKMDMRMINWFGDGNGYVGNIDLKPEVANTISGSVSLHDTTKSAWGIKFTPYYTMVQNYIDVRDLNTSNTSSVRYLQFENHDAVLFGADLSGYATLWQNTDMGTGSIKSNVGITRGFREDGGSLYHMMPFYAKMSLNHAIGKWKSGIDMQAVAAKETVDTRRSEPMTPGYTLVDLRTSYELIKNLKMDLAATNLFNKTYALPLGGLDVVNNASAPYAPLQGMGRSYNVALNYKF
jgi:iron complex outermembrane receptor protein